jgi:hypothetical protein
VIVSITIPLNRVGRRTAEILSLVVEARGQSLDPFLCLPFHLYLHPGDRRLGSGLHVRVQDGPTADQNVQGVQVDRSGRCGGMNRSCRSAPDLHDGVALQQLWTSTQYKLRYIASLQLSHLFLLQLELLRLEQLPGHTNRTVLRTQHEIP